MLDKASLFVYFLFKELVLNKAEKNDAERQRMLINLHNSPDALEIAKRGNYTCPYLTQQFIFFCNTRGHSCIGLFLFTACLVFLLSGFVILAVLFAEPLI